MNTRSPRPTLRLWLLSALLLMFHSACQGFSLLPPKTCVLTTRPTLSSKTTAIYLSDNENNNDQDKAPKNQIDVSMDDRLYRVRLPRFPGIEWGTDLSFSFVYVREMDPSGGASMSGQVEVGDQLCELKPVDDDDDADAINLVGAPFDYVMGAFAGLKKGLQQVDLVFFRGTKEELKALCTGEGVREEPDQVTITVIQNKGSDKEEIRKIVAPTGCNVREVLTNHNINVYQSITRWTNCKGKQLCGTCIVNVTEGAPNTNRKSMDEESTLRENPDSYRLSCVTFAYGDITVETFPPIEAAQWTR
jgi:ferredoxin